jgi:hypothetical protein
MPDLDFIKQGNKKDKYINPQSDEEDQSPNYYERGTKQTFFKKQLDLQCEEHELDNMMNTLSVNDPKIGQNPNYMVLSFLF